MLELNNFTSNSSDPYLPHNILSFVELSAQKHLEVFYVPM